MARFVLVVRPDGRSILTSAAPIPPSQHTELVAALREWQDSPQAAIAVIGDCDVVQVTQVDLELGTVVAVPMDPAFPDGRGNY